MQIEFYANKKSIIKVFEFISKEFKNLCFLRVYGKEEIFLENILNAPDGYFKCINMTFKNSPLYNLVFDDLPETEVELNRTKFTFLYSIEFHFGFADDSIYKYDFSNYNPYKKAEKGFLYSRLYVDSYYASDPEQQPYREIYKKIVRYIKKHSTKVESPWLRMYLLDIRD